MQQVPAEGVMVPNDVRCPLHPWSEPSLSVVYSDFGDEHVALVSQLGSRSNAFDGAWFQGVAQSV